MGRQPLFTFSEGFITWNSRLCRKIPSCRCGSFSHEDYLKGDYDSRTEAYKVADDHNAKRSGSTDDIYYVYDDQGTYIRGNEAVSQKISP
jgi:hypothetical protein